MRVRSSRPALALSAAAALWLLPAASARGQEEVRVTTTPIAPGIHMLQGRGGNVAISAGEDGVFLVDDQYAPLTEKIVAAVRAISDRPIRFVINTHWHSDHTGGNENLGQAGAVIVAHDRVRQRMSTEQFIAAFDSEVPPSPPAALPVVTFADAVTLHLNGDEVHVFHPGPAHTDGDSIVHFRRANVVHAGDLVFAGLYPFIDASSGGSVDGVIAAVRQIVETTDADTRIIPGHGPLIGRADLEAYADMLETVRDRVAALKGAGKTLEEVVASRPTAELDAEWGDGYFTPEQFVGFVYTTLPAQPAKAPSTSRQ